MTQYKTQYGTIFAVKEHNGAPAIMCRAEHSETWSLSSMIEPYTPGAWTAEELQAQLDSWAATKGWTPVEEKPACLCEACTCTGCHEDCFGHCKGCGHPVDHCNSYQTGGEKFLHQDKEDAPCNEEQPAPTGAAAATTDGSAAVSTAGTTTTSASGAGANSCGTPAPAAQPSSEPPAELAPTAPASLPAFDFGALDAETAEKLRGITDCVMELYQTYAWGMAYQVGRAHDLLCGDSDRCETVSQRSENGQFAKKEKTFTAWCAYIGVERRSAYNLLNAYRLICKATPEQQKNLQLAPAKLLYETGKKDVPDHLVNAVLDGDITKTKQFLDAKREWQAKLDAEHAAREQAEQQRDEAVTHIQAARDMQIDTARERDAALRRATEAEKQRDGARDALQAAKLRGDKLKAENDALKAQPVEAKVIDEEEVDRRAKARAAELTAPLREELEALRNRHPADPEAAEQAIRDAYDSTIYTGRVIENAWHTLRPLLPCMDAERRDLAIRQLSKTIATIQGEIAACL